jgi:hypothetical protein
VKLLYKTSAQKAQNRLNTQLINATSCIERSDTTIRAEDLSYSFSYQMLTTTEIGDVVKVQ